MYLCHSTTLQSGGQMEPVVRTGVLGSVIGWKVAGSSSDEFFFF
jgi:hypothetical protein